MAALLERKYFLLMLAIPLATACAPAAKPPAHVMTADSRGEGVAAALAARDFAAVHARFSDGLRANVSPPMLESGWNDLRNVLGAYQHVIETRSFPAPTRELEVVLLQFERGVGALRLKWTADKTIEGMRLERGEREQSALTVTRESLSGNTAAVVARFSPKLASALPAARFAEVVQRVRNTTGDAIEIGDIEGTTTDNAPVVVHCTGKSGPFIVRLAFRTGTDILEGIFFAPGADSGKADAAPPPYADPNAYAEREVAVGPSGRSLPATLSMPKSARPVAALVLVHGSGPQDRDETMLANKPFRDLALGLATREVAVLRYDKRTFGPNVRSLRDPNTISFDEETVDDAVAAAQFLLDTAGVDPERVFVVGHSQGGMAVPRILEREPRLRGGIILAGPARPFEDMLLDQIKFLVSLQPTAAAKAQLADLEQKVARVKAPELEKARPEELPLGVPASFWLSLKGYAPADRALALQKPLLILQGERDFQVTMVDFEIWRTKLGSQPWASLHSLPGLNHLFEPGDKPSTPAEYNQPGHLSEDVIKLISEWILAQP